MSLQQNPTYPSRRTYVLKLRRHARADLVSGRLENLVTGRQWEFASAAELLQSIAGDLCAALHEQSTDPPDP
jgi:hypothetical protein